MKARVVLTGIILLCALAQVPPATAQGFGLLGVSVGAYAGSSIPIAQDDVGTGGLWGIRGRVKVLKLLAFEPSFTFLGSSDETIGTNVDNTPIEVEAPDFKSFSFNLLWGGAYYGTAGIGSTKVSSDELGDQTETTYNFGGGLEIGVASVAVDVGTRLFVIKNGDGSRKNFAIMAGVNYALF